MEKEVISQVFGWTATIIFSLMVIPQIAKTIRTKSVKDVSFCFFAMYLIGNIVALIYSILISQSALTFKYTFAILVTAFYIFVYVKYQKKTIHISGDLYVSNFQQPTEISQKCDPK